MPRNQVNKQELKTFVEKVKNEMMSDSSYYSSDPKSYANKYLNKILDKLNEYRY